MNSTVDENSISSLDSVSLMIPLKGGAGATQTTNMEPAFKALCEKYKLQKKICRRCYASNSIKAKVCRKRKCGRCADLRLKKVIKVKGV